MTLTLNLKPQLEQQLQQAAIKNGLTLEQFLEQDLEQRWLLTDPLAQFSSIGLGESELSGKDSKAWLKEQWSQKL
jgi:urease accessory protein UreF